MADPLQHHRDRLATAEAQLRNARDGLMAAAKRTGMPTTSLFADAETFFVPRSVAERWVAAADKRAHQRFMTDLPTVIQIIRDSCDPGFKGKSPRVNRAPNDPHVKAQLAVVDMLIAAGGAASGGQRTAPAPSTDPIAAMAAAIIAAGEKARAGQERRQPPARLVVDNPAPPPPGSLAEQILAAGAKRRGEVD